MSIRTTRLTMSLAAAAISLASCGSEQGEQRLDDFEELDAGTVGCSQPIFPADQPDISPLSPPRFVTATGDTQRQIAPGQELLAEIAVNGAARQVHVELRDAWFVDRVAATDTLETSGNETVSVSFVPSRDVRGRFYMRITLCGTDCDEREILFDIIEPDIDNQFETGTNADYERTVIEMGDVTQVDQTCVGPNSVFIQ